MSISLAASLRISPILGAQTGSASNTEHPVLSMDTAIQVNDVSSDTVFQGLLRIARENQIPMGIVVADSPEEVVCEKHLTLGSGKKSIADLVSDLRYVVPAYKSQITEGVLEITPNISSKNLSQFLDLRLEQFRTNSEPHVLLADSLWTWIRARIAPGSGSNSETLFSLNAPKVRALNLTDRSVNSILDTIAKEGAGAAWVLHASKLESAY